MSRSRARSVASAKGPVVPSLRLERQLLRSGCARIAGMDEVGRGAIAGPVSIGVVVVDLVTGTAPKGVRDSKLLTRAGRTALVPRLRKWAVATAVGHASAAEIDRFGLMAAMRLAGLRALAQVPQVDRVILDGNHDYLNGEIPSGVSDGLPATIPPVVTRVKADLTCSSVAAASVLAKVERDELMTQLAENDPDLFAYGWHENAGYSTPEHKAALVAAGLTGWHRRSWRIALPGLAPGLRPEWGPERGPERGSERGSERVVDLRDPVAP